MFSPNELLHFAFADGNDSYYCNELLVLDLHQYLWLKLHEQGYGCVYFLELSNDAVCLRTYGDRRAQDYTPDKAKIWPFARQRARNNGLRKWLLKTLGEKEPARSAIVCDLRDFCSYFEKDDWESFLRELAALERRNGILLLTAPPEAEATQSVFLNSPVFDRLRETGITELRDASLCDLYTAMYRNRPDRMVYLNAYTKERIHSLLTRMLLEDHKRTVDADLLPEMEDFLLQWMNNPELRAKEVQLERRMPAPDSRFQSACELLRREESWSQLTAKAAQIAKAGGIKAYLAALGCSLAEDPVSAVCVRRDPDSYAWRCTHLRLRLAGCSEEEQTKISQLLEEIRAHVCAPRNREENPQLAEAVNGLLPELQAADFAGDAGTVRRILFSINFCVQWISVPEKSSEEAAILTVLDKLRNYIECSKLYHNLQRSYALIRAGQSTGEYKLAALRARELEKEAEAARRTLNSYEDVVQAAVVKISLASVASVSGLVKSLSEELSQQNEEAFRRLSEDWEPALNALEEDEETDGEQSGASSEEEEEYILTEDDYDIMPSSR